MKTLKKISGFGLLGFLAFSLLGCNNDDHHNSGGIDTPDTHYVILFDGDDFKGDNVLLNREGDFPDLSQLPDAKGKNWADEADSFVVGDSTQLTVWAKPGFKGDSTRYESGSYLAKDGPESLKIRFIN